LKKSPHLLLVVSDPKAKECYVKRLQALSAEHSVIETPEALSDISATNQFHGLVLDVHSFVRLSGTQKETVKEYTQILPTLKLFINQNNNDVIINHSSFEDDAAKSFEGFVKACSTVPARAIRREQRYGFYINILIGEFRTTITDISRRGSFIFGTELTHNVGDQISITAIELSDQTPIKCLVRRKVQWGTRFLPAGIGVEFTSITESQSAEIEKLISDYAGKLEEMGEECKCQPIDTFECFFGDKAKAAAF